MMRKIIMNCRGWLFRKFNIIAYLMAENHVLRHPAFALILTPTTVQPSPSFVAHPSVSMAAIHPPSALASASIETSTRRVFAANTGTVNSNTSGGV
jgi:hypothetical protein